VFATNKPFQPFGAVIFCVIEPDHAGHRSASKSRL